jgi:uncharacterized DUF497 family protein
MSAQRFEWDEKENSANGRKHGISFDEAKTAFLDDHARVIPDPDHSEDEERFVLLGLSISLRVLVVCHCYRRSGEVTVPPPSSRSHSVPSRIPSVSSISKR